ncbi:LIM and calponin homology domains-containing protein 1-like isoform X3 [Synchiropus splendidus]|uniref:LIM and calponin homology domains-containing protein 1-like isoform X3 n=1 Tax=Synchiropus splendidus TaxID=270530 RepID=UPI00237D3AFD|nr:LIM and calponin homology domains-containing protein 1-like isoform X3 [Synchiropus splendidus]
MASRDTGRDAPDAPRDGPEASHPEPACQEAQKWIEAVTGKSFGEKDFRSALENGILLCELLSAIKPGLVKKINRLPTPIAGLDNLSVFLRGCEELGLKGSQLFDPGDLQDTSIRANLKDSDCNRKLKNVLNTVFWLGKAASGCASYSGPTLNLKEFEGLLAQMKVESDDGGDGSQKRSVRDSGYDCWDSERSDSLSPPRHTRDNSLDSLDSFGSRSQHSPSPDVVTRVNSDGRGSDSEADGPNRRPDVRKDDMLARRMPSCDSRSSVPFNQFLPNRSNATSFVPVPRRKPQAEEGEQRSSNIPLAEKPSTTPPSKCANLEEEKEILNPSVPEAAELHSPSPITPSPTHAHISKEELIENVRAERETKEEPRRKPSWLEDDLPPMMMSRRVAYLSEDTESASMSDIANEDEVGHLPSLSQSRYERMHEQYNNFQEDDDQWQDDLARWKNRRRSASQELIKKEEERKRMEKKMKEDGVEGSKRKSIKTYKEIVEEKERREAELCEAYKKAASPEEAAMVLQRYALRFTISDATLDSLKLPRSNSNVSPESSMVEHKPTKECESPEAPQRPEPEASAAVTEPEAPEESSSTASSVSPAASDDVQQLKLKTPQSKELQGPVSEPQNIDKKPPSIVRETEVTPTAVAPMQLPSVKPTHKLPSPTAPTSRPVPLLTAKPYGQPRNSLNIKMDGLVRVNGDASVSSPPVSPLITPEKENKPMKEEIPTQQSSSTQELHQPSSPPTTSATLPPSQSSSSSSSSSSSGSTISSLFPGRNCVVTTMIVTELTQTLIEPYQEEGLSNGEVKTVVDLHEKPSEEKPSQPSSTATVEYSAPVSDGLEENSHSIETPILNLAKRVNHWVWDPNEERKRQERWQQEQERLLKEQYQKEQEKLKKEWEKAQLEVEEEERRHNEEERKILEETVAPLYPSGLVSQQSDQKTATPTVPPVNNSDSRNGHNPKTGKEDQHVSKLHFLQESLCEGEPLKKQEMWKTASLDRNSQLDQDHFVKRSGSHEAVAGKLSQPPSPSRCVSGKRLCSGCSQPLGKGAAMIIDTLGLFFHMQCFKCGVCQGQLGDTTAGTDVRIRNGLLSCNDCYIASRGRGQPTTL